MTLFRKQVTKIIQAEVIMMAVVNNDIPDI